MVIGPVEASLIGDPWRVPAREITLGSKDILLVEGHPVLDLLPERLEEQTGVPIEVLDDLPAFPATVFVLKRLRQIPMIEGDDRLDIVCE